MNIGSSRDQLLLALILQWNGVKLLQEKKVQDDAANTAPMLYSCFTY